MIVGNGLIASAFRKTGFESQHHVIFASGVSNSGEQDPVAYQREIAAIKSHLGKSTTFVYFSTTSLFDPTKKDTHYLRHKRSIENLIEEHANSFLIVRLPIMVGPTENPHTLINFIVNAIRTQTPIPLHKNACRHLLDIDDLVPLLRPFLVIGPVKKHVNILGSGQVAVPSLIDKIENILDATGLYDWREEGACYEIPKDAGECVYVEREDYVDLILKKHLGH